MKQKFQKHINSAIAVMAMAMALLSCSKWDDFKKYKKDGEITYTGKIDSIKVYSGNGRVRMTGVLNADPKINKIKVYWNNFQDSVEFAIDMSAGARKFDRTFDVGEGIKSFVIYTYDISGNQSVKVNAVGQAYGPRYANTLSNRVVGGASSTDGISVIEWLPMDLSAGPFATEVRYTTSTGLKTVRVPIAAERTTLTGILASATTFSFRTLYLPQATSIDTFATAYVTVNIAQDVTAQYLKNTKVPFAVSARDDRWAMPADWITNTAVRNFRNGAGAYFGGIDHWFGGPQIAMEAGWSNDNMATINNGKIYQTVTLPKGNYTLEINIPDCSADGDFYTVVDDGSNIPNTGDVASALGYLKTNTSGTHKVSFTLNSTQLVSMGFVANLLNKGCCDGMFFRVNNVRLKQLPL